ncbi:photosynthetic reaction center cytochrome c subunit [Qipengyuania sp. 6B39]|uniref:photosynthetic reaction center cytochrome PufC n=1 Tax=Qipengyuania proteolytica TaxID=2867239 RepID=UPI001C897DB4|nr:photosynthetic reaction center cytochrome PufC [Qipengyuania proteolytica]MBX7497087.1 photosynthetic reaction center cytochrome c subunit [Qipengyuania proteolytica]
MKRILTVSLAASLPFVLAACELAPKESYQNGYRGTGMNTVMIKASAAAEDVPAPPYDPPGTDGRRAGEVYENLQVLGDVSEEQFNYTMAAITAWVAPAEGCNYCHNPANMASDEIYTKVVARRMIAMNRNLNQSWTDHVGQTGVTCWTCHRGEAVPSENWALPETGAKKTIVGNTHGQNDPVSNSAYSSLPNAAVARYLLGGMDAEAARVVSKGRFPSPENTTSTMEAEETYAMMMHISQALGVNCTYCHNANSFQSWSSSNPPRRTAWYGLDMVRSINFEYITPLAPVFPEHRKGPLGDPLKVNCTTCHRGQNKPLGGYPMAKDYPALWGMVAAPAVAEEPAEGEETTTTVAP